MPRTSHIVRHYAKKDSGDDDKDVWIDIEYVASFGEDTQFNQYLLSNWSFIWDINDTNALPVKIYNPNDDTQFIEVKVPFGRTFEADPDKPQRFWQGENWTFDNSDANDGRTTRVYRVKHAENSGSGGGKTVDDDQYIDVEIVDSFGVEGSVTGYQVYGYALINDDQIPAPVEGSPPGTYRVQDENGQPIADDSGNLDWPFSRTKIDRQTAYTDKSIGNPGPDG